MILGASVLTIPTSVVSLDDEAVDIAWLECSHHQIMDVPETKPNLTLSECMATTEEGGQSIRDYRRMGQQTVSFHSLTPTQCQHLCSSCQRACQLESVRISLTHNEFGETLVKNDRHNHILRIRHPAVATASA